MLKVISMANISNFSDMINALPKEGEEFTEDLESPVSPPASSPSADGPILVNRFMTPNGITSISNLPKRQQIQDLLKNGPLSAAAVTGTSNKKENRKMPRTVGIMNSSPAIIPHTVPHYIQPVNVIKLANAPQPQVNAYSPKGGKIPSAKIIEQPAENRVRFRFPIEGRSAGSIAGVSSTVDHKTFPTIGVVGYKGPAKVVVSCVEDKAHSEQHGYKTYREHPHNLVGKNCKEGVCIMDLNEDTMTCQFANIGVQCVTKRQIEASLQIRKHIQVDPFGLGFDHKNSDRTTVRLCFQVFLKPKQGGLLPLVPVVSDIIKDKRAHPDLQVVDISDDSSPVQGGKKILLFCSKIKKEDIEILFIHYGKDGEEVLTTKGEFGEANVHDQSGISFKTPPYTDQEITEPVKVSICLRQPAKNVKSEPQDFWYLPNQSKVEARNVSIDNDLKQKILMIQRIAEEAKLLDLDVKKEENDKKDVVEIKKGSLTPPPTFKAAVQIDTRAKDSKSAPINTTDTYLRSKTRIEKPKGIFKRETKPIRPKSHFPLSGSYGGIINVPSSTPIAERGIDSTRADSGFIEPLPRNIISKTIEEDKQSINDASKINNFLQQEQRSLANCVRLIAIDMEEFEKEPSSNDTSTPSPIRVPFMNFHQNGGIIPNQEVFQGTCADESASQEFNTAPVELVRFPSQPLDLSSLSSLMEMPTSSKSKNTEVKTVQNSQTKVKRKRTRKTTETSSINMIPMTPMPHVTKEDDSEEGMDKTVSSDSALGDCISLNASGYIVPEQSVIIPKKRKRTSKEKDKRINARINNALQHMKPVSANSTELSRKTPPTPVLIPEIVMGSPDSSLSMPIFSDIADNNAEEQFQFEIKKETADDSDLDLGLVIDTDAEED